MRLRWSIIWALCVGAAATLALQVWLTPTPEAPPAPAAQRRPAPLAEPGDPTVALRLVRALLDEAGVAPGGIQEGIYPLRGPGRRRDEILPLLSFTCPTGPRCGVILDDLALKAPAAGLTITAPAEGDRPDRPRFRALASSGRPILALRAFPPGPRLTVIRLGATPSRHAHMTYAARPEQAEGAEQALALIEGGHEVWMALPARRPSPPLNDVVTRWGEAGAAGVLLSAEVKIDTDDKGWIRFARTLRGGGVPFLDPRPARDERFDLRAFSIRGARVSHVLRPGEDVDAQLSAIEAALVLEGAAVVLAPDDAALSPLVDTWIAGLLRRGTLLFRASEIVL